MKLCHLSNIKEMKFSWSHPILATGASCCACLKSRPHENEAHNKHFENFRYCFIAGKRFMLVKKLTYSLSLRMLCAFIWNVTWPVTWLVIDILTRKKWPFWLQILVTFKISMKNGNINLVTFSKIYVAITRYDSSLSNEFDVSIAIVPCIIFPGFS